MRLMYDYRLKALASSRKKQNHAHAAKNATMGQFDPNKVTATIAKLRKADATDGYLYQRMWQEVH